MWEKVDQLAPSKYSPYRHFSAEEWAAFRADTPLTLSADEVKRLRSLGDPIDLNEVRRIYLSLSRLLYAHVEASQLLFRQRKQFLNLMIVLKHRLLSVLRARLRLENQPLPVF